jgi:hypothetical protein
LAASFSVGMTTLTRTVVFEGVAGDGVCAAGFARQTAEGAFAGGREGRTSTDRSAPQEFGTAVPLEVRFHTAPPLRFRTSLPTRPDPAPSAGRWCVVSARRSAPSVEGLRGRGRGHAERSEEHRSHDVPPRQTPLQPLAFLKEGATFPGPQGPKPLSEYGDLHGPAAPVAPPSGPRTGRPRHRSRAGSRRAVPSRRRRPAARLGSETPRG